MKNVLNLDLDDSGARHPTHGVGKKPVHGFDWFALGGVLIADDEEEKARALCSSFTERWKIDFPLHSSEIRAQSNHFRWLRSIDKGQQALFYEELYQLLKGVPALGIACVIDRPGYRKRYLDMYKQEPWLLCKTAFSIVVERAVKHAKAKEMRLRVAPEKCNLTEDNRIRAYYDAMKSDGMPFDAGNSSHYHPEDRASFSATLYELRFKEKSSPMAQLADLYLWPMCMGGYHFYNQTYYRLCQDGKLIECHIDESRLSELGTKYSCFEDVVAKPQKHKSP